jgi:Cu(I)/Ag(I) efflux system protein CusF
MDKKEMPKSAAANSGTGVVKSVDAAAGSITFAHEPIKSLNWPAMTMAFKVKDKSLLDRAKPGDKVQFTLVQSGKDYVVTSIK